MELAKDDNLISGDAWRKGCLRKFSPWPADGCKIDEVCSIYMSILIYSIYILIYSICIIMYIYISNRFFGDALFQAQW